MNINIGRTFKAWQYEFDKRYAEIMNTDPPDNPGFMWNTLSTKPDFMVSLYYPYWTHGVPFPTLGYSFRDEHKMEQVLKEPIIKK